MTQQIINVGTGPDSYTGDTLRTAFQKTNSNFSDLYVLVGQGQSANLGANTITANIVTVSGNVTGGHFIGDGSLLSGVLGNLAITTTGKQTISGTVSGTLNLKPYAGSNLSIITEYDSTGIQSNLVVGSGVDYSVILRTGANNSGRFPPITLRSNLSSITINGDRNVINFNAPANTGYNYNFANGAVYSKEFYADANLPTGYQFTTPGGLTGLSHSYQNDVNGNVSLVRISHDSTTPAKFYDNNTTLLSGNLVVVQTGSNSGTFPNAFIQSYSTANSYTQLTWQNLLNGASSTGDIVITSDNGTDTTNYIDLGMTSSGYDQLNPFNSLGTSVKPNTGYLYVKGLADGVSGNLTIGTVDSGTATRIIAGGIGINNVVATFSAAGLQGNVQFTMANVAQWTSNVYTVGDALNQLAARIWRLEHP